MTERIDHVAAARKHIDWAHEQQEQEGDVGNVPRDNALLAQAEATLALVEQQRIANLIALSTPRTIPGGGTAAYMLYDPETRALREDIRQGLGL